MIMKNILFIVMALSLLIGCSKTEEKKADNPDQTVTDHKSSTPIANHRYGIKSGKIQYTAPMNTNQELYFDEYGAKELFITSIDLGMAKSKTIEIRKDGFSYSYQEGKTEGQKRKWITRDMDYSKADPKTMELYKVKDLGTETIDGKECKKFRAEFGGAPILSWSWNNIMVKSVTKMGGKDFVIEAVKIQETSVDPKMFELPQGVTFKEM
jgi:hypothetical protein